MAPAKQNTPGSGGENEVHVAAYFALLLNTNSEIEDFKLQSNVQEFGNLDDLLVDIKTKSGKNFYFAFQLKHKENLSKNLLPTNLEAIGDFNLEKYCEAFKNLKENRKYHFILYTNQKFVSSRTKEVKKFYMKQDECSLGRDFFDTSGDSKNLYKFEVNEETEDGENVKKEDYREFFAQFGLYTGQANIGDLEKSILNILKYNNKECYAKSYIDFFRRWHRGVFTDVNNKTLDKKTFNIHLLDILLSSVAINYYLNSNFFEEMVQQFDVTIIDASKQDFIKQLEKNVPKYPEESNKQKAMIRLAKDYKFIDRLSNELTEETRLKLVHYFYQKLLILDFNESSKDVIYKACELCKIQENGIKLVIVGRNIDASKFSHLKIFTNLTQVNEKIIEETKKSCKLSLQGRNISFGEIFEDEIREFVTPREIFQMLKGSFSIGEDKEKLPECYIPRTVSVKLFDIESIIKHSSGSTATKTAIIFYYEKRFEDFKILIQNTKDILTELPTIILKEELLSTKQFKDICKEMEKKSVHLFKVIDGKRCLLLMSTNNIFYNQNYESAKIEEKNIHVYFNNSINILCALPGMGKSTMMKYLKNESGPNFWTLRVDLKAHNNILKENHKIEDLLTYFLEVKICKDIFLSKIKKMFLEKRRIVFFLDGLDELENECGVACVLNITRQLSEMGFRIWLSSRQNLQQKIEQYFNIFTIEINEVNEDQQKNYIENRLKSLYKKNEIEEIVDLIFNNTDLAKNRQILEIPLQLHIITQIFLNDNSHYSNLNKNNSFILTKMFKIFFEGKYKHYLAKAEVKFTYFLKPVLEELLKKYETVALHSVLDDEHFQKLKIDKLELTQVKDWDFLGIITKINNENKAVFEHLTYAEYFASNFLVKNFDKARILKEEIFTQKYQNLFLIFNIMLAEDSPLHLSIIYKDLSRIQEMGESSVVDKGGRNFLQVAACVATTHPLLDSRDILVGFPVEVTVCLMEDQPVKYFKGEDLKMKEIVNRLVSSEPFKNDNNIFEWNCFDYALANGALYILEALLDKFEKPPNFYKMLEKYYRDEVVAYYSIRFGYHRLLSEMLAKKCAVTRIMSKNLNYMSEKRSIVQFLFESDCTNRERIVDLLTGDDINKIVYEVHRSTLLHFAVHNDDTEFIIFLLEKGACIDVKDINGRSPLFFAAEHINPQITKLLIEKGADVNIKDNYGYSPLLFAIQQNNLVNSKLLIENGANVNIKDKHGKTPLFHVVDRGNLEVSTWLVQEGAEVNSEIRDAFHSLLSKK